MRGSGNLFRDLALPNPELEQLRSILAARIIKALDTQRLTVRQARISAWESAPGPATVGDRLVQALGAIGDAAAVASLVTAYREAGVTLPAIRPIGFPDAPHYRPTLEACAGL